MKYCVNCGTQIQPNSRFCGKCGTKVTEEINPAPSQNSPSPNDQTQIPPQQFQQLNTPGVYGSAGQYDNYNSGHNNEGTNSKRTTLIASLCATLIVLVGGALWFFLAHDNKSSQQYTIPVTQTSEQPEKSNINSYGNRNTYYTPEECLEHWPYNMPTGGSLSQFAWLSTYELKPRDLYDFSKYQLRILRNAIFAMHGYVFQSDDLYDYFSNFSGYDPYTKNVTGLNRIENANISLIKKFE